VSRYIALALLELAKLEFRKLWRRHQEDAIQTLHLVQVAHGIDVDRARQFLAWLEYELGVKPAPPPYPKPPHYPGPAEASAEEQALEDEVALDAVVAPRHPRVRAA
jgi:hypothetical protein